QRTAALPLTRGEETAVRYGHGVIADARARGWAPSTVEVRQETLARCMQWAASKVEERWAADGLVAPPPADTAAWATWCNDREELALAKLRKDGTLRAIE